MTEYLVKTWLRMDWFIRWEVKEEHKDYIQQYIKNATVFEQDSKKRSLMDEFPMMIYGNGGMKKARMTKQISAAFNFIFRNPQAI